MIKKASAIYDAVWSDFNEETIDSAKWIFLDTLGALIAGMQQQDTLELAKQFSGTGSYQLLGTTLHADMYSSGLVHGTACVATEMDEGNQYSKGHPAAHVIPVILTMLQRSKNVSGQELISIIIKGYEYCSRFGRATTLLPEAHAHGTWGVMGAAATALMIDGADEATFQEGVNLSASFSLPTLWTSALEGKLIRNIYAGHAIEMGMKSVIFARTNHLAPKNNVSTVFSTILGSGFNWTDLERGKNVPWDIELNYFKPYAFCRYVHSPIDAFKSIIDKQQLGPDQIEKINVYTYARASSLSHQDYENILSSKFSIPFAIAVQLYYQKANQSVFIEQLHKDKEIKEFAKKVFVQYSAELEKDYPLQMPARVEIIDSYGNIYSERVDIAKGGPGKKLSESELIEKFKTLTSAVYSSNQQDKIIDFITHLETETNIEKLFVLLELK
ncbi:MmgE/PrpD family protein [Cytobacillus sp. Sa5YUA1]|uniref:MmgE/PrpD family protein n=1 Tax=Cytobacillus stercorigallinarum TaxID=2762240 RepID=A0ABR8QLN7_9BACI|nr:MmgE/PrpD family protein [Cytobacillus stercorigallinarum]MBD7936387.1 MmgE/PrpD family protein [Cytobacillus stercorigallinarum]